MLFPAVRVVEYVSVAQQLSTSLTSLRYSSIFGIAEVGGFSPIDAFASCACYGWFACVREKPWPATDGSHVM